MIFITVGTTLHFDELIEAVDSLVGKGQISESVVCQIGNGKYIPKNCEYFRFQKSIEEWIHQSSLVICHGGTGTVFPLITMGKAFVAVANSRGAHDHQSQFLSQLGKMGCLLWTRDIDKLHMLIQKASIFKPQPFHPEHVADDLTDYLNSF